MLIVYGKGVPAIANDLHIDIAKAQEIKDSVLKAFPDLKAYLEHIVEYCKTTGYVKTFYGRKRRLPDIQLDEYDFEFDFDVDEDAKKYYKGLYLGKLKRCRSLNDRKYIIEQAKTKGVKIRQNGGFIAKAERESYNCVDAETEILTADGWKHYYDVCVGDIAYTVNLSTGAIEPNKVEHMNVYNDNNIPVVTFEHPLLSAQTTLKHNWVVYHKDKGLSLKHTDELIGMDNLVVLDGEKTTFIPLKSIKIFMGAVNTVWCPTVKNKTWIARRFGTVFITGNSPVQGCLHGDSLVLTQEYGLAKIKDLAHKSLHVWDGKKFVTAGCAYSGQKRLVNIKFTGDRLVQCSEEHKFLTTDGKFLTAKELADNKDVAIVTTHPVGDFGNMDDTIFKSGYAFGASYLKSPTSLNSVPLTSKEFIRGLLSALFDVNGNITKGGIKVIVRDKTEEDVRTLQTLLSMFSIEAKVQICKDYALLIVPKKHKKQFGKQIGSEVCATSAELDALPDTQIFYSIKIKSIQVTDTFVDMYDIINSETHKFVVNGIVTHNSAADITKKAMLNIATNKRLKELGAELVLTIHDETMTSVPKENAYEASKLIEKCSIDAGEGLGAPLRCDVAISDCWEGQQYTFNENHELVPIGSN